jgi:hypothetical protein
MALAKAPRGHLAPSCTWCRLLFAELRDFGALRNDLLLVAFSSRPLLFDYSLLLLDKRSQPRHLLTQRPALLTPSIVLLMCPTSTSFALTRHGWFPFRCNHVYVPKWTGGIRAPDQPPFATGPSIENLLREHGQILTHVGK